MTNVTRSEVEDFFYHEAELLDSWKLEEWLQLFLPDGKYMVPSLSSPELSSKESLYLVMDDYRRLSSRVHQYLGGYTWAESPFSQVRRLTTNVRIITQNNNEIKATANFSVHRFYQGNADTYIGQSQYILHKEKSGFRIREKKSVLAMDVLRPQGKLTIIL